MVGGSAIFFLSVTWLDFFLLGGRVVLNFSFLEATVPLEDVGGLNYGVKYHYEVGFSCTIEFQIESQCYQRAGCAPYKSELVGFASQLCGQPLSRMWWRRWRRRNTDVSLKHTVCDGR
jgi:hypothetical protein